MLVILCAMLRLVPEGICVASQLAIYTYNYISSCLHMLLNIICIGTATKDMGKLIMPCSGES